jgi:hypothetical protein
VSRSHQYFTTTLSVGHSTSWTGSLPYDDGFASMRQSHTIKEWVCSAGVSAGIRATRAINFAVYLGSMLSRLDSVSLAAPSASVSPFATARIGFATTAAFEACGNSDCSFSTLSAGIPALTLRAGVLLHSPFVLSASSASATPSPARCALASMAVSSRDRGAGLFSCAGRRGAMLSTSFKRERSFRVSVSYAAASTEETSAVLEDAQPMLANLKMQGTSKSEQCNQIICT